MKFGKVQINKFGTNEGAYSLVTERENYDSQVTLTDYETELIVSHFGQDEIHVGSVGSNKTLSLKTFKLFPSGAEIKLNVIFPKPSKTELRLYLSSRSGFKPKGGDVWFIFSKGTKLWIGSLSEPDWREQASEFRLDSGDEIYQNILNDNDVIRIATLQKRDVYVRDRKVARERLILSKFTCDYDPIHELFISRFTEEPYLEAHHLIPMGLQKQFEKSLDTINNVFCLCPQCHRAVHQAEKNYAKRIISKLAEKRPVLNAYSLSINDLFGLYAVETIE